MGYLKQVLVCLNLVTLNNHYDVSHTCNNVLNCKKDT